MLIIKYEMKHHLPKVTFSFQNSTTFIFAIVIMLQCANCSKKECIQVILVIFVTLR